MREIKYRAKRPNSGKWIMGYPFINSDLAWILSDKFPNPECSCEVLVETVGQYIGLKDKGGKEVYEGDIVEVEHPRLMGYVGPRWEEVSKDLIKEKFAVEYRAKNTIDGGYGAFYLSGSIHIDFVRTGKVIGNIYKNPELIE